MIAHHGVGVARPIQALQAIVEVMRARGYGQTLIEKLCFRNWLRVLERTWGGPDVRPC